MTIPAEVDPAAPVTAHQEIEIQAPLDDVWLLHVEVNGWPTWQTDITDAHLDGSFEPGASFDWTSFGFGVTSTIYDVAVRSRVLWGGTADGITGIHEWLFAETPAGVKVTTNESFAGAPVDAAATEMQSTLDASLTSWLRHLKAAAESHALSASPR